MGKEKSFSALELKALTKSIQGHVFSLTEVEARLSYLAHCKVLVAHSFNSLRSIYLVYIDHDKVLIAHFDSFKVT